MTRMAVLHYDIPDELHRKAKSAAALKGQTLKAFLIEALEKATKPEPRKAR